MTPTIKSGAYLVTLPISSVEADMAGMPSEWLERAVQAVGVPHDAPPAFRALPSPSDAQVDAALRETLVGGLIETLLDALEGSATTGFSVLPVIALQPEFAKNAAKAIRDLIDISRAAYSTPRPLGEYEPKIIHYDGEGDSYWQFVERDTSTVTGQVFAANVEMLTDFDGNLIGFTIYDPSAPRPMTGILAGLSPSQTEAALQPVDEGVRGWRDIATAPKNKRIIGVWKDGKWCAAELWWDDSVEEWTHTSGDYYCKPTHWMLPPPIEGE